MYLVSRKQQILKHHLLFSTMWREGNGLLAQNKSWFSNHWEKLARPFLLNLNILLFIFSQIDASKKWSNICYTSEIYVYTEIYLSVESIWISLSKNSLNIWGHVEERCTCNRVRNSCIACVAVGPTWKEMKCHWKLLTDTN